MFIEISDHMLYRLVRRRECNRHRREQLQRERCMHREMISQHQQQRETFQALGEQNITMHSTPLRQNIGINEEMQSRSANSLEFPGFIIFKLAMKMHSEKTD